MMTIINITIIIIIIHIHHGYIIIFHQPELLGHLGMISLTNHDSSEGEQWGRYNLPR